VPHSFFLNSNTCDEIAKLNLPPTFMLQNTLYFIHTVFYAMHCAYALPDAANVTCLSGNGARDCWV